MGERKWTEEQLSAIETRDRTLLVSAAAGSGKTATLTERIIRSLTDSESPVDIDSLLVVTFTNAAARELRVKLSRALEEATKKNPEDKRLQRQLFMLPAAKIRTIDAFCNELLRANCDRVGVPPNYRIADGAECELLGEAIVEGLIDAVYRGEMPEVAAPEEFDELADCLTDSGKNDELGDVFRMIRERCDSAESGVDSLLPLIEKYNPGKFTAPENTSHGEYIIECAREMAEHYISVFEAYSRDISGGIAAEEKYLDMLSSDLGLLRNIYSHTDYEDLYKLLCSYELVRKPSVKKDARTDRMEDISDVRDMMKKDLAEMAGYFTYSPEQWRGLYSSLYRLLSVLYRFVSKFDALFLEEKRRRGALSYGDIERYTYKCLIENGKPTDIAMNLRGQFRAIYIDEYQDVNSLQNSIFAAISREDNRFMVGDIKQSIYGFRQAEPEIFAQMKHSFPPLSADYTSTASVFMSKNFRCDRAIVDFVNGVFDKAFSLIGKSIGYSSGDRLGYAKVHDAGEPEYKAPEICMLEKPPRGESGASDENEDEEDYTADSAPEVVAKKIQALLKDGRLDNGEPIKPSDIAIILRFASGRDYRYADALSALGIPVEISGDKDFFLSSEVLLVLCLLNSIDNPRRDIYLAGLMCSPLFSFDADDLYLVRNEGEGETLYESLVSYCKAHPEFTKGIGFLDSLGYYRAISEGIGVDTLLHKLYHETGLYSLAANNGGKENLTLLYDYARSYEAGAFRGLYNFINFVNNLIDKKTSFDDNREGGDKNAVKIVTCHASKGLEYPVVFLCEAGAQISNRDKSQRLSFSGDFGIAFRLRSPAGLAIVENPARDITNHYIYRKLYDEELRILYVALTRAREQLYVVGTAPVEDIEKYRRRISLLRETLTPYTMRRLISPLEIMLVAGESGLAKTADEFIGKSIEERDGTGASATSAKESEALIASISEEELCEVSDELYRRFTYEYPNRFLTVLPEKMSVSKTSPTVLDGTDDGEHIFTEFEEEDVGEKKRRLPGFVEGRHAEESAKRGIATHYLLQFCDLENLKNAGAAAELDRLIRDGFISQKDGERVRINEIEAFRRSSLFADMLGAKKVYRELRFNVRLPAHIFTTEEEKRIAYSDQTMLVQGVIDCIVEYEDGTLGLYDYKTDRLTREQLTNRALAERKLRESHSTQLSYYAMAVEKIFGKAPERVEVYSLALGNTVSVKRL